MKGKPLQDDSNLYRAFCCPDQLTSLELKPKVGFLNKAGELYKFIDPDYRVIDFVNTKNFTEFDKANSKIYDAPASAEVYRNFLDWLFATFNEDEMSFRQNLIKKLRLSAGQKVLITGCGFGDDIGIIYDMVGNSGEIHAQDLSKSMVLSASNKFKQSNVRFSVSTATALPYKSRYFDAVFHFGGINLFGNIKKAIAEMERVCKVNGTILFGDEGIASHLRDTQYAEIAISNNKLWASQPPMELLPYNASKIELSYILGNCFYIIQFSPSDGLPAMNIDILHKGLRGGTARTRYFGQVEGLTLETKQALIQEAKNRNTSIHALLEESIKKMLSL
ncbi:class I SAM-dependent methyltransferase [Aquicella lusitana]|uniref:Methyltransferase family protein n=1 Tax=Aquicella lusitana TaxID=254246 RepID=A0A370GWY9_9COXI|nr:methyltransferase domain-containing protein [Aquicella lusitana]RDI48172.1 methyltransferase family protein [Aquicella lusitana]VVC72812.1 Demethylmenaquinone methyltransferase [Aquicella lusitana]